jgi:hypothetical protein
MGVRVARNRRVHHPSRRLPATAAERLHVRRQGTNLNPPFLACQRPPDVRDSSLTQRRSGRRTLVIEAARLFGSRRIRRRVGLTKREGLAVWPLAPQQL